MMKRFLMFLCCAVLGVSSAEAAVQKYVLDNGLTVLVTEMPSSPVAAINIWIKTGSANEGKFLASGVTHFVEHMLFKGTTTRPPGSIPAEARALGGYINASTGYDHTVYILSVPKENMAKGVGLLSDMVISPAFDAAELEKEREVIVKEMRMLSDKPERKLNELAYETIYHVHPYQFPIIGREDVFRALKREDLVEYHHTLYVPNNMIVSVAGGVKADEVLAVVKEAFKGVAARSFPLRNLPQEPDQIFPRRLEVPYATDVTRLIMAYQSVALLDQDLYALDVLAMALGQGESSRLFLDLYKKRRLVESVSAGSYTPQDRGFFGVSALIKEGDADAVIMAIKDQLGQIKAKGLLLPELEKVKRQVMTDNIYRRQTAEGMADSVLANEAFTGDPDFSDRYLDGVRAVSNEDIMRVARKYLTDARLSIVVLKPKTTAGPLAGQQEVKAGDIEKVVLPNGLVLLLKEDHSLPIVSFHAVFNGGMRQETLELNGLSSLVGSVWTKGLPGESSDQIRARVEARGAGLSAYSGRNSFVFSMTYLAEDQGMMLDYLEKFMSVPAFPEDEIARDKEQMLTALMTRKDSVMQTASRALVETLFEKHPFRYDSLGSEESLGPIKRKDLVDVFRKYIRSDNGVVAVFGDIDKKKMRGELERRLGKLSKGRPVLGIFSEEAPSAMRLKELRLDKGQAAVLFGFRGPTISDNDRYASEVLVNVLSSSLGGRLFKRVREEFGQSYAVSGGMSPAVDAGMISFYALTSNDGLDKVRLIMEEEFLKVRQSEVSEKELADAKAYLIGDMARDMQTLAAQSITRAVDELLGLGYRNMDEYAARINAVTLDDVRAVALKYLDLGHAAIVLSRAGKGENSAE